MALSKLVSLLSLVAPALCLPLDSSPTVQLANGSYYGITHPTKNVDQFLGIPYAQPPLGDLRFRPAQPLSEAWSGLRNATTLQTPCYQYGSGRLSGGNEDCLTLNVIRPANVGPGDELPVAFWIHGGGLVGGSNSDPYYDMASFVAESANAGKPVVVVAINYRLHAWGYLWGSAIEAEGGGGNLGFRDQRLALHWVRDNVAAFGGDPAKVTIWGQSGGARGVASQLTAYGGRDDGLFRAAILQSATGFHTAMGEIELPSAVTWDSAYNSVLARVGCADAADSLACLRTVPGQELATVFGNTAFPSWLDVVDGEFIQGPRAEQLRKGNFVRVPVLTGTTTDDGDYFAKRPINTDAEWEAWLREGGAANDTIAALSALYPDDPAQGLPATFPGRPTGDLLVSYGAQWKRAVAFGGDRAMQAPRRAWAKTWADAGLPLYSYRFNVVSGDRPAIQGVGHSAEMPFVFRNLGVLTATNPGRVLPESFERLSLTMTQQWVRFMTDLDPNGANCVRWPTYDKGEKNLVFSVDAKRLMYTEEDTFRAEQFAYLDSKLWHIGLGRD